MRTVEVGAGAGAVEVEMDELVAAGLWDGVDPERGGLCELLLARGCSVEEMVEADARGRLYGLLGDRVLRPSAGRISLSQASERLGVPEAQITAAWVALGLGEVAGGGLTELECEALELIRDASALMGVEAIHSLLRVAGAGLARLAEAEASLARGDAGLDLARTQSEQVTAEAWELVGGLAARIGVVLDAAHRHHLEASRALFESFPSITEEEEGVSCGVGFADISGFTAWSASVGMSELSEVLRMFEAEARSIISSRGGRVVKHLGDAVMWVHPSVDGLAEIAWELTASSTCGTGLAVRAGIAHGGLLVQDGDYFGVPVNLAARLVGIAAAGEVRVPCELAARLGGWVLEGRGSHDVKGFAAPVEAGVLRPRPVG